MSSLKYLRAGAAFEARCTEAARGRRTRPVEQDAGGGEAAEAKALIALTGISATGLEILAQDPLRKIIIRLSFAQLAGLAVDREDTPPINSSPLFMSLTLAFNAAPPGSPPR